MMWPHVRAWMLRLRNVLRRKQIVGKKLTLDHVVFTIAGVMPAAFHGAEVEKRPDVFVPLALESLVDKPFNMVASGWRAWWLSVGARLRDGVSLEQANAFLRAASKPIFTGENPNPNSNFNGVATRKLSIVAEPGATGFSLVRLRFRRPLLVVMTLVIVVLLVACLNLASLLLARSVGRERELATRLALGAARGRLLQQLLTESLLIAVAGAALGFLASLMICKLLVSFLTRQDQSFYFDVTPDCRVFAFVSLIALSATFLVGIIPALKSTGRNLQERVKEGSASIRGVERRHMWPRILMGSEIALALVLVTGAGLLGYSLVQLHAVSLGFSPVNVTLLPLDMMKQQRGGGALLQFYHDFYNKLSQVHGVTSVSYASVTPISGFTVTSEVQVNSQPTRQLFMNRVGPRYFASMSTLLLAGREFRWSDTDATGRKVIVNAAAARLLFPHQNPIHQQIDSDGHRFQIIGVAADAKYVNLREPAPATMYFPITQDLPDRWSYTVIIRDSGKPGPVVSAANSILKRLAPEVPLPGALSMEQQISDSLAAERLMALLASFFAIMASIITAIGLYRTLAFATARRTGEIGIRMALGAQRGSILKLVLQENLAVVIAGCALGLSISLACTRFIASFLYQVRSNSPVVLMGSLVLLLLVGLFASLLPALRASRLDPMSAIRHE